LRLNAQGRRNAVAQQAALECAAEAGDVVAQCALGNRYESGFGSVVYGFYLAKDEALAIALYSRAAAAGYTSLQYMRWAVS